MIKISQIRFDIAAWKPVRLLIMSPSFPVVFQIAGFCMVMWLTLNGIGVGLDWKTEDLMTLRKANLTTLAVWGLWWPAMIGMVLALGRIWCTICPMELLNRVGDAIARRVGFPRARLGKFLRAGWVILTVYLILQILVAGFSIHRVPYYTSIFLIVLMGGALLTGMAFKEPRSFCRAFCPASALLSVYGRYTPLQLEVRNPATCESCMNKDCIRPKNRRRFDKRSCPSLLVPFRRNPSDGCVLCFQCVKACPYGNMGFGLVNMEAPVRRKVLLSPFEAAFVMAALGFVAHEVIGEIKWLDNIFHFIPEKINILIPSVSLGWFEALWFLILFPLLVWAVILVIGYLMGHRGEFKTLLLTATTGAAPVIAVAHLAKALAKIASWGEYLPLTLRDPIGIETFYRIHNQTLVAPDGFLDLPVIGWIMLFITILIARQALYRVRQIPTEFVSGARSGLLVSIILFCTVLGVWVWSAPL